MWVTWVVAPTCGCGANSNRESKETRAPEIAEDLGSWVPNDLHSGWGKIEPPAGFILQEGEVNDTL